MSKDRSAEAVARAFLASPVTGCCEYAVCMHDLARLIDTVRAADRRARDAAWRRAVRQAFAAELKALRLNRNAQELLPHMLKLVLAAAPGARRANQ